MNEPIEYIKEIKTIVVEHRETGKMQDSLEIGTPAKGGAIKVYCDFSHPEEAKKKIDEAVKLRGYLVQQAGA